MLIVCPSCASEYTIDPAKLGADGRTVRCAICHDTWMAGPAHKEEVAGAVFILPVAKEASSRRRRLRPLLAAGVVLGSVLSAWPLFDRTAVEQGSRLVQEALAGPALPTFHQVLSEVTGPQENRALVVTGELVNETGRAIGLRPLEFLVRNGDEQALATWTSAPPQPVLPPGETVRFEARLPAPPPSGRQVEVHFIKARGIAVASRSPL